MFWLAILVSPLVLGLLMLPMAALAYLGVLYAAGWLFQSSPSVSKVAFYCPFSKREVAAEFLARPTAEGPVDVLSCSRFAPGEGVRCAKSCLELAKGGWTTSLLGARYALLSGGVAYRPVGGTR